MTWFTQGDIVELFDEASDRSRYELAFEERAHTPARFPFPKAEPALTYADVLRMPIPYIPRWEPPPKKRCSRKAVLKKKLRKRSASEQRPRPSACQRCGASAPNHRCAATRALYLFTQQIFKTPEPSKQRPRRHSPRSGCCQKCGAKSPTHRCPAEETR